MTCIVGYQESGVQECFFFLSRQTISAHNPLDQAYLQQEVLFMQH